MNVLDIVEDWQEQGVRTTFLAWSANHFSSKQWLHDRNEKIKQRSTAERNSMEEGSGRLDVQLGAVKIGQAPSVMA